MKPIRTFAVPCLFTTSRHFFHFQRVRRLKEIHFKNYSFPLTLTTDLETKLIPQMYASNSFSRAATKLPKSTAVGFESVLLFLSLISLNAKYAPIIVIELRWRSNWLCVMILFAANGRGEWFFGVIWQWTLFHLCRKKINWVRNKILN